jgi:tRNA-uridine 2-sulfurtransferase
MAPLEIVGDSARDDAFALARLVVDGDRILEADAPGMDRDLAGLTLLEAAAVPGETLAADAVADAIGRVAVAAADPRRVAVAMSGGVDSAVTLLRAGPHAVGVTLRLWADPRGRSAERICCSPAAVIAARRLCHDRGLPHLTLDLREAFRDVVVAPFVAGYAEGLTPNPCTRCNGSFRFDALLDLADRIGAEAVLTGHYARTVERDGLHLVGRAADPDKDQSYMLAAVDPAVLRRVRFPLGADTKVEVRAEAAAAGLEAARRPESQEACFLAGDDYRAFLAREGVKPVPGPIVDESGALLGVHDGVWNFTPGQRRGIGVSAAEPLYALRTDGPTATLVVGPRRALGVGRVSVAGTLHVPVERAEVKLRYRSQPVSAHVQPCPGGFKLDLDSEAEGIAPGQLAVLYADDAVVGFGTILKAW